MNAKAVLKRRTMKGDVQIVRPKFDVVGALWTLVRTDFKVRYHDTLGGFLWALLKPALTCVVLLAVFGFIFAADSDYKLNLVIGIFLYEFFSEGTRAGVIALHAKGFLLTKTSFPRWIVVVASSSNAIATVLAASVAILLFLWWGGHGPTALGAVLFFVYVFLCWCIIVGLSLAASGLFLRYRDLNQIWDVVLNAGFFVAPVIYPLRIIPEQYHFFLYLWPPTAVIQFSREVMVAHTIPSLKANLLLVSVACVAVMTGVLLYQRHGQRAVEHL